jgi:tetratricopeptide (TPR) repeat protein
MNSKTDALTQIKAAFARATALIQAGDLAMAEAVCRESLQQFPGENNLSCLLGAVLIRLRKAEEAESLLQGVTARVPEFAKAHEELANAILAQNQPKRAISSLERVLEIEPANELARYKLNEIQTAFGAPPSDEATLGETDKALMEAALFRSKGNYPAAEELYQSVLAREPENAKAYQLLGSLATEQGQFADAAILLKRATSLSPDSADIWIDLANACLEQERFSDAEAAARRAIQLQPDAPRSRQVLAGILSRESKYSEAVDVLQRALELMPGSVELLLAYGHSLRTVGRQEDAIAAYRKALEISPGSGGPWWALANLKTHEFSAADRQLMQDQLERDDLDDSDRVRLGFALAKANEDAGEFDTAFALFAESNSLRRKQESHDPAASQQRTERFIELFNAELLSTRPEVAAGDPVPVFIVGMPRSGTTLVEQILASHSQVDGTRELPYVEQLVRRLQTGGAYPGSLHDADEADLKRHGDWYLEKVAPHRGTASVFTDKAPGNFWHIGLLAKILPQAKFINVRRHPLDSCMGSYKQLFAAGQSWSYDLFEIGEYCLDYHRLMAHWRKVLPGAVLDVDYEDLVKDIETEVARVLDYCDLAMEPACLAFHETQRAVESASSEQVRLPLYNTAVNRWRDYEAHLGELIEVLRPLVPAEHSQK